MLLMDSFLAEAICAHGYSGRSCGTLFPILLPDELSSFVDLPYHRVIVKHARTFS